ncbi:MAG: hypothetical protein NC489_37445 [Ruminococcus flavefaciens]|nr:hypothetical protein [Ruminococcus flavefaciens]
MSTMKVLKSLVLGMPLAIFVQHCFLEKIIYTDMFSIGFKISCTMLILVFCVLEEYLVFYKNYNWKEKLALDIIWTVCTIFSFVYALRKNPYIDPFLTVYVYGVYLFGLYVLMRIVFICIKEIKKMEKNSVKKGWH